MGGKNKKRQVKTINVHQRREGGRTTGSEKFSQLLIGEDGMEPSRSRTDQVMKIGKGGKPVPLEGGRGETCVKN